MSNLFKRAALFTDIHYGAKSNSFVHNTDCANFVSWFIKTAKARGCDTVIFLGDWHNHRSSVNVQTLEFSVNALEQLNAAFNQVFLITGNHDLYFRDKRDCSSVSWAKHLSNITLVNDWLKVGDCLFTPWLVGNEFLRLKQESAKYLFGHYELPNFYMNSLVQMPDHGETNQSFLNGFEKVFSGHFHKRQVQNNVVYIGNAFPHNFSDVGDTLRGMSILEWGEEPEFISWPEQPTFHCLLLSSILDKPEQLLKNSHVKVNLDIQISFEEAQFIKETFVPQYGLREMSFMQQRTNTQELKENGSELVYNAEPVDKIILNEITTIKSDFYDPKLLLQIYNTL